MAMRQHSGRRHAHKTDTIHTHTAGKKTGTHTSTHSGGVSTADSRLAVSVVLSLGNMG